MSITIHDLIGMKNRGEKISMITAYDYPFARIADEAGIDVILVGDSLGMVVQGLDNTLSVSMDEMIYHTKMVTRAASNSMVMGDMPFLSYQTGVNDAIRNAGRFLKEAGATAVKIEGGAEIADHIRALTRSDIPVMAHIGLTPQSIHRMGGYKVQGRTEEAASRLMEEARIVEDAGAFSLLLEAIPMDLARNITASLTIPTIGIGAGPYCDGQVLVLHDVIGLFERFVPRFVKRYANIRQDVLKSISIFREEIKNGKFPSEDQSFK